MSPPAPQAPPAVLAGWMGQVHARLQARVPRPAVNPGPGLRRAGVLAPLFVRDGQLWILFTLRTETVEHHRGQISFPGGGQEPGDASLWDTALREAEEEIGLNREDPIALGSLSPLVTVTNFYVEPYVAAIPQPYVFRPHEAEIAQVLEVPVASLMNPDILEKRNLPGREQPVLFYRSGEQVIWGATAGMLEELLDALRAPDL